MEGTVNYHDWKVTIYWSDQDNDFLCDVAETYIQGGLWSSVKQRLDWNHENGIRPNHTLEVA